MRFQYRVWCYAIVLAWLLLGVLAHSAPDQSKDLAALQQKIDELDRAGNYAEAIRAAEKRLKLIENSAGSDRPETAAAYNRLGELYGNNLNYAKAESLYGRALEIYEKTRGPEHPDTGDVLTNLAVLYGKMGYYSKAPPLLERALKIDEKALGPEHPDTAADLSNLAESYLTVGDFAKAEPLYQRAIKIYEKTRGPDHPDTAETINNLAGLYSRMGDYAKVERLYQRALKIREKTFGPDDPTTGESYNNLALYYVTVESYGKAEPLFQRALRIYEKARGPEHPETAIILDNLAFLYFRVGDYAKAEPLYQRALQINEKVRGTNHPKVAKNLKDLGLLYDCTGDYTKVEPLYRRGLRIEAKSLGLDHPETAKTLKLLAQFNTETGNNKEAERFTRQTIQAEEKGLANILSFASEQQRLAFQRTTHPYDLPGTLGNACELAELVLCQKGAVLDSLLEDRLVAEAGEDPKRRQAISALRDAKQRLMKLQLETPKDVSEEGLKRRDVEKQGLSAEVEELESGLAREVAGLGRARRALRVTVPQVQSALKNGETLIESIRYDHYLGRNKFEARYGAVVIPQNSGPRWVPLGPADKVDRSIQLYQKSMRGQTDEATFNRTLRDLFSQIWQPIEKALPSGNSKIIISPDGQLSFVSFAKLVGPDEKFLSEKYSVRYVASGRDLLRTSNPSVNQNAVVYANPDFGATNSANLDGDGYKVALRSVETRDLQNMSLPALPGTALEGEALRKRFGGSVNVFVGPNATKVALQKINSPRILHLATHGFFFPEIDGGKGVGEASQEVPKAKLVNPMHRSGMALAGAQKTLEAWSRGEFPPIENNGILTAEEVGGLRLNGTWLVVLSACDTGSGEARTGEGVMGLRRGFIQAGAQNLVMTLWPISDQTTVQIMLDFYDAADKTKNAPKALADVQRDWLVKLRKERGVLDAVRLAGAFIMSSQGRQ